ncbi:unnamed protein product [Colias eurytheme]|nr:unnamed protein product [Colias eurytheme]
MRPRKRKDKKQKRKPHKKSKIHKTHKRHILNIAPSDFDIINQINRDHEYQLKDVKKTWKVVPKDSCEVYKDRRKREDEQTVSERDTEENQRDDTNQKAQTKRRVRRPLKRDSRGRFLPESSKCSCCSRTHSDTSYDTEASYDD